MKAILGIYYQAECGRIEDNRRLAAVLDVERWLEARHLPVGQQSVATAVCAALDEYPDLVEAIMQKYQAALDDADQQAHALLTQSPGLSD